MDNSQQLFTSIDSIKLKNIENSRLLSKLSNTQKKIDETINNLQSHLSAYAEGKAVRDKIQSACKAENLLKLAKKLPTCTKKSQTIQQNKTLKKQELQHLLHQKRNISLKIAKCQKAISKTSATLKTRKTIDKKFLKKSQQQIQTAEQQLSTAKQSFVFDLPMFAPELTNLPLLDQQKGIENKTHELKNKIHSEKTFLSQQQNSIALLAQQIQSINKDIQHEDDAALSDNLHITQILKADNDEESSVLFEVNEAQIHAFSLEQNKNSSKEQKQTVVATTKTVDDACNSTGNFFEPEHTFNATHISNSQCSETTLAATCLQNEMVKHNDAEIINIPSSNNSQFPASLLTNNNFDFDISYFTPTSPPNNNNNNEITNNHRPSTPNTPEISFLNSPLLFSSPNATSTTKSNDAVSSPQPTLAPVNCLVTNDSQFSDNNSQFLMFVRQDANWPLQQQLEQQQREQQQREQQLEQQQQQAQQERIEQQQQEQQQREQQEQQQREQQQQQQRAQQERIEQQQREQQQREQQEQQQREQQEQQQQEQREQQQQEQHQREQREQQEQQQREQQQQQQREQHQREQQEQQEQQQQKQREQQEREQHQREQREQQEQQQQKQREQQEREQHQREQREQQQKQQQQQQKSNSFKPIALQPPEAHSSYFHLQNVNQIFNSNNEDNKNNQNKSGLLPLHKTLKPTKKGKFNPEYMRKSSYYNVTLAKNNSTEQILSRVCLGCNQFLCKNAPSTLLNHLVQDDCTVFSELYHRQAISNPLLYCNLCSYRVTNTVNMLNHVFEKHSTTVTVDCNICAEKNVTLLNLKEHKRNHFFNETLTSSDFYCITCNRFADCEGILSHFLEHPHNKNLQNLTKHIIEKSLPMSKNPKLFSAALMYTKTLKTKYK